MRSRSIGWWGVSFAIWVTLVSTAVGSGAETPGSKAKAAEVGRFLRAAHRTGHLNGAVLVVDRGEVLFRGAFGSANFEWKVPNTVATKFRLASISKQFTAMVILQLVEEGKIDLEAPLTRYLPSYRKDTGDRVTIHHLLNHTSGIPSMTSQPGFMQNEVRDPIGVEEMVRVHCSGDLEFEPGMRFRYNNSGYYLLGAIIEVVTGETYEAAVRSRIFDPLGMAASGYDHNEQVLERRASGYQRLPGGGYVNAAYIHMSVPYAAGSLYSTVDDLFKWDRGLRENSLLDAELKAKMFSPGTARYGYGWFIEEAPVLPERRSTTVVTHGGGIFGFGTRIRRYVDVESMIVVLDNTGGDGMDGVVGGLQSILFGLPYEFPEVSAVDRVLASLQEGGVEAAAQTYDRVRSSATPFEAQINRAGYTSLQAGLVESAIEIFSLNIRLFPTSANTYDSLGEAYMTAGRIDEAISRFEKAMEIDPQIESSKKQLEKLRGRKSDPPKSKESL